jgi:hypothetical protein
MGEAHSLFRYPVDIRSSHQAFFSPVTIQAAVSKIVGQYKYDVGLPGLLRLDQVSRIAQRSNQKKNDLQKSHNFVFKFLV